jgi:hypothetical protein
MPMSTSTGSGDETTPDDVSALLTRGVVDGFTEASEAFSTELQGTDRFPDLMGRSVAGVIRANARLLDELATVVRQMSDGYSMRSRAAAAAAEADGGGLGPDPVAGLDYERLADLVAQRLKAAEAVVASAETSESAGRNRKA